MNQEDKELLLKDLSARLTYGVKINYSTGPANHCIFTLTELNVKTSYDEQHDLHYYPKLNGIYNYFDCLPYLRPMSSMNKEEQKEFVKFHCINICPIVMTEKLTISNEAEMFDWLNVHHFDYRGLIEKGLAIKVTKENNPYE